MRYKIDHDFHIHSQLSLCSNHPEQTKENILKYAVDNSIDTIIITDHFWDATKLFGAKSRFYDVQKFEYITKILPLPQHQGIKFLFGCETEMSRDNIIGISPELYDEFEFIIVPTTHFHMVFDRTVSLEERAHFYVERFKVLLNSDLPFHKTGVAHLTTSLIANGNWEDHMKVLDMISDEEFCELFNKTAELGMGVELNFAVFKYNSDELVSILRPYRIAKKCGCKFYFGSDAHTPEDLDAAKKKFEYIVDLLDLTEEDKFLLP